MNRAARILLACVATCLTLDAGPIVYDFSGTVFIPSYVYVFQYTSSAFITTDTLVPASALDFCGNGVFLQCSAVDFLPSGSGNPQHVPEITILDQTGGAVNFYFPLGSSFASIGTLNSVPGGGTLTVSNAPEPLTWLLVLAGGFPIVGLNRWRHRNRIFT